ncbi:MAG: 50S ribosomal protein L17 [Phycisphaerales bacterium]|nr:50S ribosomal protein L17 [Phycisphaerales bacterium]
MRHRRGGYKLGRTTAHRAATLRNLAISLLQHGQITTTIPKAKTLQPFVEKIITDAKEGTVAARRRVASKLGRDQMAFDWLYVHPTATDAEKEAVTKLRDRAEKFFPVPASDKVVRNRYGELTKSPKIVKHLFENVAPRFKDRTGGYTRIVKLGKARIGDGGEICVIQFVGAEDGPEIGGNPSTRRRQADKRVAFAAKVRKAKAEAAA